MAQSQQCWCLSNLTVCAQSVAVITQHYICACVVADAAADADAAQHLIVHNLLLILLSTLFRNCNCSVNCRDVAVFAGNEMDLTMVNLDDVLPQATIMVVSVTASTTSGQPLSSENLQKVQDAAAVALQLDEDKIQILQLVQQKMHKIAPNLSTAVGTEVAARLMGVAGGLINLSKMPACNVQVLL